MSILATVCIKQWLKTFQPKTVDLKLFATATKKLRENEKPQEKTKSTEKEQKTNRTNTKEMLQYMDSKEELKIAKTLVSPYLLKSHKSAPEALYLVSSETAKGIVKAISTSLSGDAPVIEVNPGIGCLTKQLMKLNLKNFKLFESSSFYEQHLNKLKAENPGKFSYTIGSFFGMWKLAFQDKMDGGNRLEHLLEGIETKPWEGGVSMKILGSISSTNFINHLILSVIFQENIVGMGRPELFITMPPSCYYSLVAPPNPAKLSHLLRPMPVLFSLLFEHEVITKVSRKDFLPWQVELPHKKITFKIKYIDSEYLYLVRIVTKPKSPCSAEHLPLLWYFCKHHLMNQNNKVIPLLEQWVPGCGVWLITGQDPPGSNTETLPTKEDAALPHMNIFTQFSDLSPEQKLTVFKKFISWPEFHRSPFKETVENHLFKTATFNIETPKDDMEQDEEGIETH